jgi:5-methylcytosine-specific restriction endonuclease McrA
MKRQAQPNSCKIYIKHPIIDAIIRLKNRPRGKTYWRRYLILRRKFYACKEWKVLSKIVKQKAGFRCKLCKNGNTELHVHHIQPIYYHPELALCIWNLICLCRYCHNSIHKDANAA